MITPVNLLSSSRTKAAASALSPLILRAITAQQQPHEGGCHYHYAKLAEMLILLSSSRTKAAAEEDEVLLLKILSAQQQPHEGGCFL